MNPTESISLDLLPIVELGLGDDRLVVATDAAPQTLPLVPGCADVQFARVGQIGHRGRFPRAHEWEKLLSSLPPGEELLWVVRKHQGEFELFLGHKTNRDTVGRSLEVRERRRSFQARLQHFSRRVFPESRVKELKTDDTISLLYGIREMAGKQVVVVGGMPSPKAQEEGEHFVKRDDALDLWASLNDVLEQFLHEDPFTIVFSLCRARDQEVRDRLDFVLDTSTRLGRHMNIQRTKTTSAQEGSQDTEGRSDASSEGRNTSAGIAVGGVAGVLFMGGTLSHGVSSQKSQTITKSTAISYSKQNGESVTLNEINSKVRLWYKSLELQSDYLRDGLGTGAFYSGAMVYAKEPALARRIGQSIMATLSGTKTHVRPFQVITYEGAHVDMHLTHQGAAHQIFPGLPILSTHLAAQSLLMPEADLPGVRLRRNVFYGQAQDRDSSEQSDSQKTVSLGKTAFSENFVTFGNFPPPDGKSKFPDYCVPDEDLVSHLLITGTTGSGKTFRAAEILNSLKQNDFQIVVIESAKQVFRNMLRREGKGPRVFTLGESREKPLRINPFFFEMGTSLKRHISVLSDALADLLPVEALIAPKLREAVQRAYTKKGWNIEAATFDGPGDPEYPSVLDLHHEATEIACKLRYGAEVNANYLGALTGRTGLFIDDLYQDIFAWDGDHTLEELFGEDDVIIELDALPPSEIQMPGFFLAVLLERLRARQAKDGKKRPRLLLVIEEAHNLLNRKHEVVLSEHESGQGGHLLDQLVLLLQEGREMRLGVVVIDQSPTSLADSVLKNTNTKIVHRIADSEEAKLVGSCIGLRDEEWRDLQELGVGECIVKGKSPGKAVKLARSRRPNQIEWSKQSSKPPNYAQAARLLETARGGNCDLVELEAMANELILACCKRLDLLCYVVRKASLDLALETERGKSEFKWREPFLPESLGEVRDWLGEYAGKSRKWSERRKLFATLLIDLINGKDVSPSDDRTGSTWWYGPLEDFKRRLAAERLWRENPERGKLFSLLKEWTWLGPDSPDAARIVRERLREFAYRLDRIAKPSLDAIQSVCNAMANDVARQEGSPDE